jgi:hypothetical protein
MGDRTTASSTRIALQQEPRWTYIRREYTWMNQLFGESVFLKRSKYSNGTIQQDRAFGVFISPWKPDADSTTPYYNATGHVITIILK